MEDSLRRNNLRIDSISESNGETWQKCEQEIQKVFREKLGLEHIEVERAHRTKKNNKNNNKPRTVVCKLLSHKQKKSVLENAYKLKGTNIFINEDFCYKKMQHRKQL